MKTSATRKIIGLVTAAVTCSFWMVTPVAAETLKLISGGISPATSPDTIATFRFVDLVRERSGGRIDITHFPGGQLGNGQEQMEGVATGTQAFFVSSGSQASRLIKEYGVVDMAFLFKDEGHMSRFMASEMGQELNDKLTSEFGVRILSTDWYGLPRQLMHRSQFITSPADVEGVRVRTASVPMYVQNYTNMGAIPVKIDYGEQYLALSQGVVDMTESAEHRILATKLYEVAPYITEVDMMFPQNSVYMNAAVWDAMSPEDQALLKAAADEAGQYYNQLSIEAFSKDKEEIIAKGGKFERMSEDVRAQFAARNAEHLDEMVSAGLIPDGWYEKIIALAKGE